MRTKIGKETRKQIFKKTNGHCLYCMRKLTMNIEEVSDNIRYMTVDHIVPLMRGGTNEFDNLIAACDPCNYKKGNRRIEYLKVIKREKHDGVRRNIYFK